MKKLKNIDKNYFIIIVFCFIALYLIIPENCIFGSKIDWVSQHIVFPDYFRKLFYSTGNLFPNFAMNIGAGQNIYNFSYYGLLNPFILLSYLFPFISMSLYIIILNTFLYIFLGVILYYFLKSRFKKNTSLIVTIIILCAAPIMFHFHRHFMFVNYLPFLVLGFIGTDKFFRDNSRYLIVISVFFMVTMSYYYSICGILVLCIYALYRYLELNKKIIIKDMIKVGLRYLIPIIIGVMICGVLLLPTYYVLKTGRSANESIDLIRLLFPKFNIDAIVYNNYSLGLTSLAVLSLLYGLISKRRENKFLSYLVLILISIPLCIYILNGTLYIRNKIFIPFIPLFSIIIGNFLEEIFSKKIDLFKLFVICIILVCVCLGCLYENILFYLDLIIVFLIIYFYYRKITNKVMLSIVFVLISFTAMFVSNSGDIYVSKNFFDDSQNREVIKASQKVLKHEKNLVRFNTLGSDISNVNEAYIMEYNHDSLYSSVSNPLYKDFYKKTFKNSLSYRNNLVMSQNNDILFQMFMGVKYIYSSSTVPVGYSKIGNNVYVNQDVLPVLYGTDKLVNEKTFDKLYYPYNIGTLLNSAVTSSDTTKDVTNGIESVNLDYNVLNSYGINVEDKDDYLEIKSSKNGKVTLKLNESLNNDILILNIKLKNTPDCLEGDLSININGINNVLTCKQWRYKNNNHTFHYVISSNQNIDTLNIKFSKGVYEISKVDTYKLSYDELTDYRKSLSEFRLIKNNNDNIIGDINMKGDGYFVSSIPYDDGFSVYVDNKKVKTEIVNKAFLGFKLNSGYHKITIKYHSPYFNLGVIVSIMGIVSFLGIGIYDKFKK